MHYVAELYYKVLTIFSLSSIILRLWCQHESTPRSSVSCKFYCLLYAFILSSLMHVIHIFGRRPWLCSPSIWQCNVHSGNRSSILVTCPNHVSRCFLIFWTSDSSCCNILRTVSFLILSLLVTHNDLLNQAISALRILRSSSFSNLIVMFALQSFFLFFLSVNL